MHAAGRLCGETCGELVVIRIGLGDGIKYSKKARHVLPVRPVNEVGRAGEYNILVALKISDICHRGLAIGAIGIAGGKLQCRGQDRHVKPKPCGGSS